jgi:hypothetical protein
MHCSVLSTCKRPGPWHFPTLGTCNQGVALLDALTTSSTTVLIAVHRVWQVPTARDSSTGQMRRGGRWAQCLRGLALGQTGIVATGRNTSLQRHRAAMPASAQLWDACHLRVSAGALSPPLHCQLLAALAPRHTAAMHQVQARRLLSPGQRAGSCSPLRWLARIQIPLTQPTSNLSHKR